MIASFGKTEIFVIPDFFLFLACKYPPSANINWIQKGELTLHFSGYFGCYAAHMDNTSLFIPQFIFS
jgi:hypothetical protein